MSKRRWGFVAAMSMALAAACGGNQPEANAPANPAAAGAPPAGTVPSAAASAAPASSAASPVPAPARPWTDLSHEERLAIMKKVVMPNMRAAFEQVDANKYKDFSCVTCHGPGAKQGKFDMPNPGLPKLDPKDDFKKHKDKTPEMLEFMEHRVEPEMAKMLGLQPYDPATHQGFGCGNCHTFEK